MVRKIPENAHKLGIVVVDFIPLWNLQDVVGVPVGVLVRRANRYGRHLNLCWNIVLDHLAIVLVENLMAAYFYNVDWYTINQVGDEGRHPKYPSQP